MKLCACCEANQADVMLRVELYDDWWSIDFARRSHALAAIADARPSKIERVWSNRPLDVGLFALRGISGDIGGNPQQGPKASVDDRATDPDYFARLDGNFHFTIDVAASPHNAKCERFYTVDDDGLAQSWDGERVWCNPPYSDIRPWVEKGVA